MALINSTAVAVRSRGRKRRIVALIVALVATVGGVALGTGIASAASSCTSNSERGLCLAVDRNANGTFTVHVGVDVHMSVADAQEYIDDPGDPFVVTIV